MNLPGFCDSLIFCDFKESSPVTTISCFQENFMTKIIMIVVKFMKITKILDHRIWSYTVVFLTKVLLITIDLSNDKFLNSPAIPLSEHGIPPEKGNSTSDSGVVTQEVKLSTVEDKKHQPDSNTV